MGITSTPYYYVKNLQGDIVAIARGGDGAILARYTYDAWGNILSITDNAGHDISNKPNEIANINPLRYRGYYYDSETGLYYLKSRFYDPATGRFVNADGCNSTGQGLLSSNMYIYCENNPINRVDSTGRFWSELWDFVTTAVQEIGNTFAGLTPVYAGLGTSTLLDGPLPFVDAAAAVGAAVVTAGAIGYGIYQATQDSSRSKIGEKAKEDIVPPKPKKQEYFPTNPYDFSPRGLMMVEHPGTYNGKIIEWKDPVSNIKIFEWNEDFRRGSHYHTMMVEWDGKHMGMHYYPGMPIPEPWNTIYFGE